MTALPLTLTALMLLGLSGLLSLLLSRRPSTAHAVGAAGPVLAALLAIPESLRLLFANAPAELLLPWSLPLGSLHLRLDPLSAFFLLLIFLGSALSALYGAGYLRGHSDGRRTESSWFFFNLLVASMVMVVLSRNGLLFFLSWELMALSSFFLVARDSHLREVRRAAWLYLVASQISALCLAALLLILSHSSGSLEMGVMARNLPDPLRIPAFLLALTAFGIKAGLVPFHVWLPEAHPAAPTHVSALMSGVMIKTGIYGLLRFLPFLGEPPLSFGLMLIVLGALSGVFGILSALTQRDMKRLLAYSSVENIGIILMGIGAGFLGLALHSPVLSGLGFAGGLIHALNHSLFKPLLFFGAGSVLSATGSRDINRMGGLLKPMPVTAAAFLIGAAAITGLPPLSGFAGEFLIFLAGLEGVQSAGRLSAFSGLFLVAALALIGGLAAACFTKAFGCVFLGEPRESPTRPISESGRLLTGPMIFLAAACLFCGLLAPLLLKLASPAVFGLVPGVPADLLAPARDSLFRLGGAGAGLLALALFTLALRRRMLKKREQGRAVTWDCGYAAPAPRMQYSASSFAQPLTDFFKLILRTRKKITPPEGLFAAPAALRTDTPDVSHEGLYRPLFTGARRLLSEIRILQEGRLQIYVLYIGIVLLALLFWSSR